MTPADTLVTIPMLQDRFPDLLDNYGFLWKAGDRVVSVDAAKGVPILAAAEDRGWTITDILLTHHHPDHVAGVADIVASTGAKVWGNAADAHRLPPLDHRLAPGETFDIGGAKGSVWDVSGHTIGHIAFVFDGIVFTGDSLMVGGCGRLFEGTPEQMHESLSQFADLPDATLIASGHEYTATNIEFACYLEPGNPTLTSRREDVARLRAADKPTVPSTLGVERQTNPYLRVGDPTLKDATKTRGRPDVATFAAIRRAKDAF